MGVCYMLLRDDKRESFDLNKGNWGALFPDGPFTLKSLLLLRAGIADRIGDGVFRWGCDSYGQAERIADRIIEWCADAQIRMINDTGWDEEWCSYRVTADRFSPSYVKGYKDYEERR